MTKANARRVHFENSIPILRVESMQTALEFYLGKLEFKNVSWGNDEFTRISRDQACLFLCVGDQGRGAAWVWIGVEDAERLHEELKAKGVKIRMPPKNFPWALEMHIEDPYGNVLRLGSDPK